VPFALIYGPAFWYGRAISLAAALLAALFIGLTLYVLTGDRLAAAAAGLMLLAFPHMAWWSALDRADALALALSWAGLFVIVRWPTRRWAALLAAVGFSAALYTRLAYGLVAPVAALAWLLQAPRVRQAALLVAWFGMIGLAVLLALNRATAGGFLNSLSVGWALEFSHVSFMAQLTGFFLNAGPRVLAAPGFMMVERWWYPTRSWPFVTPYVLAATAVLLFVDRSAAGANAVFQAAAALSLVVGAIIAWPGRGSWWRIVAVLALAFQVSSLVRWSREDFVPAVTEKVHQQAEIAELARIVHAAAGPVLADEYMGLLPLAGRRLYLQPVEFIQLQRTGRWDAGPLAAAIQRREFAAILLYEPPFGQAMIVSRWPAQVRNAIWANYEPLRMADRATVAYTWVYLPRR
ncbi:MAG: hypothetical protein N2439_08280, partial [Anaerolineae bacterium]|nr:hypothetical protein [Anaerolineae bacterium]